ncbi:MAG: ankyrin repeat domain-containing protein [Rickettsiales bacterium]|jgi:hypothetical protein|nr:ankyrin repeat domain-containing protein [Rickettsiales bacterium]
MGNKRSIFLILIIFLSCNLAEASSSRRSNAVNNANKYDFSKSSPKKDAASFAKDTKNSKINSSIPKDLDAIRAKREATYGSRRNPTPMGLNVPSSASASEIPTSNYEDWMPELNKDPTKESIIRLEKQKQEQEKLVNELLELNYNVHTPPMQLYGVNNTANNKSLPPVYLKSEYFQMAFMVVEKDNQDALRGFLTNHNFLNRQNENGDTLLIHAIQNNAINAARVLLARKALVDVANNQGRTALHYAAALGNPDSVKLLLSMGANPYLIDNMGMTALDYATIKKQYQVEGIINKYLESE